jgi:alpha-L-fucosidase
VGKWIGVNGEAIYGTQSTLFGTEAGAFSATEKDSHSEPKFIPSWNWRSTTGKNAIYIELFRWQNGTFHLDKSPRNVTGPYLLADKSRMPLITTRLDAGLDVQLPSTPLDPIATVLVLTTKQ